MTRRLSSLLDRNVGSNFRICGCSDFVQAIEAVGHCCGQECPRFGRGKQNNSSESRDGLHFMRSKLFCRICQSLRPLTFSMAAVLIADSFVFFVGLVTL